MNGGLYQSCMGVIRGSPFRTGLPSVSNVTSWNMIPWGFTFSNIHTKVTSESPDSGSLRPHQRGPQSTTPVLAPREDPIVLGESYDAFRRLLRRDTQIEH